MLALDHGVEMQRQREFDGLARRSCGGDNDHAPRRRFGGNEGVVVWRKGSILDGAVHAAIYSKGFFGLESFLSRFSPLSSRFPRGASSGKITRPFGGRFRIALGQSVGAGC